MKKTIPILFVALILAACSVSKDIEVGKTGSLQPVSPQTIIYSLPQTSLTISLDVVKTTITKGIYADYALKYLSLSKVAMADKESYSISNVDIKANAESDPSQYYSVTYKAYPENLSKLLSVSDRGVILDFAHAWNNETDLIIPFTKKDPSVVDPFLLKETQREKVDTFYKTVMTDSAIVKIPVVKKQTQVKTMDDFAKEAAINLIKTRKRKLKILRGEYDFHPDGEALKVTLALLNRQEDYFFSLFAGEKRTETKHYSFTFIPQTDKLTRDICYFSSDKGIQEGSLPGFTPVSVQLAKEEEPVKGILPEKGKNVIFVRIPARTSVLVKLKNETMASKTVPVYQYGAVQLFPVK